METIDLVAHNVVIKPGIIIHWIQKKKRKRQNNYEINIQMADLPRNLI